MSRYPTRNVDLHGVGESLLHASVPLNAATNSSTAAYSAAKHFESQEPEWERKTAIKSTDEMSVQT